MAAIVMLATTELLECSPCGPSKDVVSRSADDGLIYGPKHVVSTEDT
jgi:hypothetical protein